MPLINQIEEMMEDRNAVAFFRPEERQARFFVVTPALWHAMWRRINGGVGQPNVLLGTVTAPEEEE